MLPERYRELLTAYVDGELSARQRRHALRLLRRSVDARRLLQRLQSDSDALIHLPRVQPDRDLSGHVLQKIAAARPLPIRPTRRFAPPRAYPAWVGAAAAAVVLCAVGAASYYFFASIDRRAAPAVAQNQANPPAAVPSVKPPTVGSHDDAPQPTGPDHTDSPAPPMDAPMNDVAQHPPNTPNPSPNPDKDAPIFTSPGVDDFPDLKALPTTDLLATFHLHDLDDTKLLAALSKDALHVELPVADTNRACERLQAVLNAHHVDLLIDAGADGQLKPQNAKAQTTYVLYSEDLTADEWTQLLQQLGADDKKVGEKKPAEAAFDALVVHTMNETDHKVLKKLMGVDPTQVAPSRETGPAGLDPRKPLSDQTGAQVAAVLGQGKPGARSGNEHSILVLPEYPVQPRRDSAEIKRFLDERKPLRPGALQVLLLLRNPSSAARK